MPADGGRSRNEAKKVQARIEALKQELDGTKREMERHRGIFQIFGLDPDCSLEVARKYFETLTAAPPADDSASEVDQMKAKISALMQQQKSLEEEIQKLKRLGDESSKKLQAQVKELQEENEKLKYEKKTSPDGATATSADAGASGAAGTAPDAPKPSPSKASREMPPDSRPSDETKPSQAEATEQATTTKDCDPNRTGSSNGTNGTNATHGPSGTWQRRIRMQNLKTSKTPDTSASSSPGVESYDISTPRTKAENWQKYIDPVTKKPWLDHADTGEYFFADRATEHGWSQYASEMGVWWHHASTGRWFYE